MRLIARTNEVTSLLKRRGITLAETALATLLVGILFVAAMQSVGAIQTHEFAQSRVPAVLLAEQLLADVSLLPWCEEGQTTPTIGRESGEITAITRRN